MLNQVLLCEFHNKFIYFVSYRSNIVWEQYKKNRWKTLTFRMCEALEEGYEKAQQGRRSVSGKEKVLDMEVTIILKNGSG